MTSPIALFTFNRPEHTRRTLEALAGNECAAESDLFIFSDNARCNEDESDVRAVRVLINRIKGFRNVELIERDTNWGLANNIIDGVSTVCDKYGTAIVLEDDILTSPRFLTFMNKALDRYADEPAVWHVSGWNYPIDPTGLADAFFWRVMNCWGWATWADRWRHFEKDPARLVDEWCKDQIRRFNLDGTHSFWHQVLENHEGRINTWAIFWYATIFEHGGLCLNPTRSYVENIGHDGSGEHCKLSSFYQTEKMNLKQVTLPTDISECSFAVERIQKVLRRNILSMLSNPGYFLEKVWSVINGKK